MSIQVSTKTVSAALIAVLLMVLAPIERTGLARAIQRVSLDDVIQWVKAGESEESIVNKIKKNNRAFDLSDAERRELKGEGVTETILKYLVDPSLAYTPPPPPPPPPPKPETTPETYSADAIAGKVPPDTGAYLVQKSEIVPITLKNLVAAKEGGFFSRVTVGLLKGKVIGHMAGASSRVRLESSAPALFYLRLAPNLKIEDVALVSFQVREQRRVLEFAPTTAKDGKPAVKIESMRQFESVLVGPKLYRIAPPTLTTGEYFFYVIGSADPGKGIQGSGYDFGVN